MPVKRPNHQKLSPRQTRELDVEIAFLEGLVRRDQSYLDALQLLGDSYTRRGRAGDSLRVDIELARLRPGDPVVHYNLACSQALSGNAEGAASALHRALDLGFHDLRWISRDPDLKALRKHPVFGEIKERLRRMKVRIS